MKSAIEYLKKHEDKLKEHIEKGYEGRLEIKMFFNTYKPNTEMEQVIQEQLTEFLIENKRAIIAPQETDISYEKANTLYGIIGLIGVEGKKA